MRSFPYSSDFMMSVFETVQSEDQKGRFFQSLYVALERKFDGMPVDSSLVMRLARYHFSQNPCGKQRYSAVLCRQCLSTVFDRAPKDKIEKFAEIVWNAAVGSLGKIGPYVHEDYLAPLAPAFGKLTVGSANRLLRRESVDVLIRFFLSPSALGSDYSLLPTLLTKTSPVKRLTIGRQAMEILAPALDSFDDIGTSVRAFKLYGAMTSLHPDMTAFAPLNKIEAALGEEHPIEIRLAAMDALRVYFANGKDLFGSKYLEAKTSATYVKKIMSQSKDQALTYAACVVLSESLKYIPRDQHPFIVDFAFLNGTLNNFLRSPSPDVKMIPLIRHFLSIALNDPDVKSSGQVDSYFKKIQPSFSKPPAHAAFELAFEVRKILAERFPDLIDARRFEGIVRHAVSSELCDKFAESARRTVHALSRSLERAVFLKRAEPSIKYFQNALIQKDWNIWTFGSRLLENIHDCLPDGQRETLAARLHDFIIDGLSSLDPAVRRLSCEDNLSFLLKLAPHTVTKNDIGALADMALRTEDAFLESSRIAQTRLAHCLKQGKLRKGILSPVLSESFAASLVRTSLDLAKPVLSDGTVDLIRALFDYAPPAQAENMARGITKAADDIEEKLQKEGAPADSSKRKCLKSLMTLRNMIPLELMDKTALRPATIEDITKKLQLYVKG